MYFVLIGALRLMGRRMASSMTRNELAAPVSLAAAVGPAMEAPDRGILAPVAIATIVVGAPSSPNAGFGSAGRAGSNVAITGGGRSGFGGCPPIESDFVQTFTRSQVRWLRYSRR